MKADINRLLIPANCIIDEDIGLLRLIRDEYSNESVFKLDLFNTDKKIQKLILNTVYTNPLDLIIQDDYKDKSLFFYKEFLDTKYKEILERSEITKLRDFVITATLSKMVDIRVVSTNKLEADYVHKLLNDINVTLIKDYKEIDLEVYDSIITRRFNDLKLYNDITGKVIYILLYRFNLEKEYNKLDSDITLNIENLIEFAPYNQISIMSVFLEDD